MAANSDENLKVFISYSRRDSSEFAEELVAALELAGFAPSLDRHDIAVGEDWQARLGVLIEESDTVVFVISPEAMKSDRCAWEIDKALAEGKRVLPVIWKRVPESEIPQELRRRQFVQFDTGFGIARPLAQLAAALRQDIDWIREHTRLGDLAARWEVRGRPGSLLLRGDEIVAAQSWADRRSVDAPIITDKIRIFIEESRSAEAVSRTKTKAALRRVRWAQTLAVVFAAMVIAGIAAWLKQDWVAEQLYVIENLHALTTSQDQSLKPGESFNECTNCPEMIVVPAGSFTMGSPMSEAGREQDEGPQHTVMIKQAFAVARFELTFAEWDTCVAHGGCRGYPPLDQGWGRGRRPVINVSWDDAQQYIAWLAKLTGKPYRLLSEAEYEYATRAGMTTAYPWGDDIGRNNANCRGCGSKWDGIRTAPVGSFVANKFGLYDMVGNVFEWTQDCKYSTYDSAPTDGSAWTSGRECTHHVLRGGSWDVDPRYLRSAVRLGLVTGVRVPDFGFRVGRTLLAGP